jgi:hypothetical protein
MKHALRAAALASGMMLALPAFAGDSGIPILNGVGDSCAHFTFASGIPYAFDLSEPAGVAKYTLLVAMATHNPPLPVAVLTVVDVLNIYPGFSSKLPAANCFNIDGSASTTVVVVAPK